MVRMVSVILAAAALVACSSVPVATDYDPDFPFHSVRHYAWLAPASKPSEDGADTARADVNDLMRERIRKALSAQMQAQGIREVSESQSADVLLTFHMGIEERVEEYDFHDHFGYYPCYSRRCAPGFGYYPGGIHHDHWTTEYQQGRLIVDMVSPTTRKLVWRGVSERRIPWLETPEERRLFIVDTVGSILSHFPPGRVHHE